MTALAPTLAAEAALWHRGLLRVAGVDEVGLGCLAGPIVAAAVVLPVHCAIITGVKDSKLLSAQQRERLFPLIQAQAQAVGVGLASVGEIDHINVLRASHLAMQRALARVKPYDHALIDGRAIKQIDLGSFSTIIDGDATCYAIACASIIAKVRRDRLMQKLAKRHPGYGWESNVGYGTKQHRQGLQELGITLWHRRSYAPVQAILNAQGLSPEEPAD